MKDELWKTCGILSCDQQARCTRPGDCKSKAPTHNATEARLRAALEQVRKFLTHEQWGTYSYMEGAQIYHDKDDAVSIIDKALSAADDPPPAG